MENLISIEGIECYAHHGCMEEEGIIGGNYTVDVYVWADVSKSFMSDMLSDTIDYVMVHDAVRKEMAVRSKLIEHVANRILENISSQIKNPEKISVRVTKHNPPVNGQVNQTSFMFTKP